MRYLKFDFNLLRGLTLSLISLYPTIGFILNVAPLKEPKGNSLLKLIIIPAAIFLLTFFILRSTQEKLLIWYLLPLFLFYLVTSLPFSYLSAVWTGLVTIGLILLVLCQVSIDG